MKPKALSSGVIVTDGRSLILGHSTGNKHWDIPKGVVEINESDLSTAVRELFEETGIQVSPSSLKSLGRHSYTRNKDLSLWLYKVVPLPNVSVLKCTSTFETKDGRHLPELDRFSSVDWNDISAMVTMSMAEVLNKIRPLV